MITGNYIFVGHRFTSGYMEDYRDAVAKAIDSANVPIELAFADSTYVAGHIFRDKTQVLIDNALFCIFDISEQDRPNVFIELGYAYGREKFVVLTSNKTPPNDLAGFDVLMYRSFKQLTEKLAKFLPELMTNILSSINNESKTFLTPEVTELLYSDWKSGNVTKKSEIYKRMDKQQVDQGINRLVREGLLEEVDTDSVKLTKNGGYLLTYFDDKRAGSMS